MAKKKYSIDLAGLMAECEANYLRLMKLLPQLATEDRRELVVELIAQHPVCFRLQIIERCKYTTMVEISQRPLITAEPSGDTDDGGADKLRRWISSPTFSLRIYHDARMAEVISYDNHHRLHIKYDYPNNNMYHSDEKGQLNALLGEWLSHCLNHGRALQGVPDSVFS
ncbi:MAG: hypothetical protein ACI9WS_000014 [Paraglaciecola psychrophila]|jgi:uncharacterized protein YqiB (DUF1249 family)